MPTTSVGMAPVRSPVGRGAQKVGAAAVRAAHGAADQGGTGIRFLSCFAANAYITSSTAALASSFAKLGKIEKNLPFGTILNRNV